MASAKRAEAVLSGDRSEARKQLEAGWGFPLGGRKVSSPNIRVRDLGRCSKCKGAHAYTSTLTRAAYPRRMKGDA